MANVQYYNRVFPCGEDQTVLDVLIENGQDIPYSCKMGVCVTCIMQLIEGGVPQQSQVGLRSSLVAKGHFLPCVCRPTSDIQVGVIDQQDMFGPAAVAEIEHLSPDICRVFLEPTTPLYYRAGQFLNLRREDGLVRSYSLASVPNLDDRLEFHIKRLARSEMSNWILDEMRPGDHLGIQGPLGNCFYDPGRADQEMLLIGNGTGLAPLIGIVRDALASGHTGSINLFHGSRTRDGLYLADELRALQAAHGNFHYTPCISQDEAPAGFRHGRADDMAFFEQPELTGWRVFLCGFPPMVYSGQNRSIEAGAEVSDIYTDPYELKDLRSKSRPNDDE